MVCRGVHKAGTGSAIHESILTLESDGTLGTRQAKGVLVVLLGLLPLKHGSR